MSASSSSSDSEGSSTGDEMPKVTTHTERVIRRYQIKKSLILERMFAIEQVIFLYSFLESFIFYDFGSFCHSFIISVNLFNVAHSIKFPPKSLTSAFGNKISTFKKFKNSEKIGKFCLQILFSRLKNLRINEVNSNIKMTIPGFWKFLIRKFYIKMMSLK